MTGKGTEWINNEVDKRLKALLAKSPAITQPTLRDVEFITFTNADKSRGKTNSGIEVDTIPKGSVEKDGWGYKFGSKYVVSRDKIRPKNVDGGENAYILYSDGIDYWVRKLGSRDFYKYTPPTVNTFLTKPCPASIVVGSVVGKLSASFFSGVGSYFNYITRFGGSLYPENPDLTDGEVNINWAYISPTFTTNELDEKIITNTLISSGSFTLEKGSISGCPAPENSDTFILSSGYSEVETSPADSMYTWTVSRVETYALDTDPTSINQYTNTFSDYRFGVDPQSSSTAYLNQYSTDSGLKLDFLSCYLEQNYPFSNKVLQSEVITYTGTYRTVFVEEFGPDEDNLTTVETPMQGNWEMKKTISYSYAPSLDNLRDVTITTTYEITEAELLEYTPVGTGQVIDNIVSGGPLGFFDLNSGTPPFGYISAYCHGPAEIVSLDGRDNATPIYFLTEPSEPTFIDTLQNFENSDTYFGDLPQTSNIIITEEQNSYYATPTEFLVPNRSQRKTLTVTDIGSSSTISTILLFDFESYITEDADTNSQSGSDSFNYDNTSFGGYSSYSSSFSASLDITNNIINTTTNSVTNFEKFVPPFDYFTSPANIFTGFKTTASNGTMALVSQNEVIRGDYSLTSTTQEADYIAFPFSQFYIFTNHLAKPVNQFTTFDIPSNSSLGGGDYKNTLDNLTIQVLKFTGVTGISYEIGKVSNWQYNTQTEQWIEGKRKQEDFTEDPLPAPANGASPLDFILK